MRIVVYHRCRCLFVFCRDAGEKPYNANIQHSGNEVTFVSILFCVHVFVASVERGDVCISNAFTCPWHSNLYIFVSNMQCVCFPLD